MKRRPPRSTLFPYPPLFRSKAEADYRPRGLWHEALPPVLAREDVAQLGAGVLGRVAGVQAAGPDEHAAILEEKAPAARSEEHTSELQSRQYLVCRLLLEKKK